MSNPEIDAAISRVTNAYAELGFPISVIGQWTLPSGDAYDFLTLIQRCKPRNVLEVGTFVGFATLLLAMFTDDDARIHTIDPNLPLRREMTSMRCQTQGCNLDVTPHDVARAAADMLGVGHKIIFHVGGFSVGDTFATENADNFSAPAIIGSEILSRFAPFDLALIDGLHYEHAVLSDLRMVVDGITSNGIIVLHDLLGRWGSNVRSAVSRFIEDHPNWRFTHFPFTSFYRAIGLLQRFDAYEIYPAEPEGFERFTTGGLLQASILPTLCANLVRTLSPRSVIQLGHSNGHLLGMFQELGVADVLSVDFEEFSPPADTSRLGVDCTGCASTTQRFDLCICLYALERCPLDQEDAILEWCTQVSDNLLLGLTPPGEAGPFIPNAKPIAYWARKLLARGYLLHDSVRPHLEPWTYADLYDSTYQQSTSSNVNLYLARRDPCLDHSEQRLAMLEELLLEKERRIESLVMQNLFLGLHLRHRERQRKISCEVLEGTEKHLEQTKEKLRVLEAGQCEAHSRGQAQSENSLKCNEERG